MHADIERELRWMGPMKEVPEKLGWMSPRTELPEWVC